MSEYRSMKFIKGGTCMPETEMIKIPQYCMKMRLYPSKEQAEKIDKMIRALHVAYNITFHEVFEKNPEVCSEYKPKNCNDNEKTVIRPDFKKIASSKWRQKLIEKNPIVDEAPSRSLIANIGLFNKDAKKAWGSDKKGLLPVDKVNRKDFRFYNKKNPRRSINFQCEYKSITTSESNPKVVWIKLPYIIKPIKARGFNRKIRFGDGGKYSFEEALKSGAINGGEDLTVCVSKDTCGDYFLSVTFFEGINKQRKIYRERKVKTSQEECGIDVGIKDVAILSDGTKYVNKHFKKAKDKKLRRLNRQLSRRWGPVNKVFRDYGHAIKEENITLPENEKKAEPLPSKRYEATKLKRALIERKTMRQRDTYYHQITAEIINKSKKIAVETLKVKNMMKNHSLAYALSDATMSSFISKLKYKSEQNGVELVQINMFDPSSQRCSVCGAINKKVKNLDMRTWECSECQTHHDRDVNAAKNILYYSSLDKNQEKEDKEKREESNKQNEKRKGSRKTKENLIFEDNPDIVVMYSKELTKINNPRYVVFNKKLNKIIDDAQGIGFRSISNAKNCYKYKVKNTH